jgi:hypothetical protein
LEEALLECDDEPIGPTSLVDEMLEIGREPPIATMRLPHSAHTSRPWRIHEIAGDFRLEDVWELPGVGGPDDFPGLVALIASLDPSQGSSHAARLIVYPRR